MDEQKAREILKRYIKDGVKLINDNNFTSWSPSYEPEEITLDGEFSADELEAMAWWMRKYGDS